MRDDAAARAVAAAVDYGLALMRKELRKKHHRKPDEQQVEAIVGIWRTFGGFERFFAEVVGDLADGFSPEFDRFELAEAYFIRLKEAIPTRGRPRKRRRGIIESALPEGALDRKKRPQGGTSDVQRYAAAAAGKKLNLYMRKEGWSSRNSRSALNRIDRSTDTITGEKVDLADDVMAEPLPRGFLLEFCRRNDLDPKAFKKQVQRARLTGKKLASIARRLSRNSL